MIKEIKNIQKLLIIAAIFLFLLAILIIGSRNLNKNKINNNQTKETNKSQEEKKEEKFSRASFFLTISRSSIAIPESWEGKYRIKDEGRVVRFVYIGNPSLESDIFRIIYSPDKAILSAESNEKIIEKYQNFSYIKEKNNNYTGEQRVEFEKMVNQVDELIKSFVNVK